MENLVNQFTSGNNVAQKYAYGGYGQTGSNEPQRHGSRQKSNSKEKRQKSSSKDRKLKDHDKMSQEIDRQLKQQRKMEKANIKKYG